MGLGRGARAAQVESGVRSSLRRPHRTSMHHNLEPKMGSAAPFSELVKIFCGHRPM